jgi:hypothetical protein
MSDSTRSLLTLLALIFASAGLCAAVIVWWCNRYLDKIFDHESELHHD